MNEHKLFINGEWTESSTGETFENINPANLKSVGTFHKASEDDVKRAVDSAEDAVESWSSTPAPLRAKILFRAARMFEERKEELARLMTLERGKVLQ